MSRYIPGMARAGLLFALTLCGAGSVAVLGGCETTTRDTDIKIVSIGEAKALWDRTQAKQPEAALFLDPRPAKYFDAAHIPGARSVQLPQIDPKAERDPRLERYSTLIVYGDDPASPVAKGLTKRLMAVGYKGVRWFAGGMKDWNDRRYPVEPPRKESPETPAAAGSPGEAPPGGTPPPPTAPKP